MKLAHIYYSGIVQGVGFRYTVHRFAAQIGLKGWVRNLSDGRVEVEAEGEESDIERMMKSIENHFGDYIQDRQVDYLPAKGEFKEFKVIT